MAKQIVFDKDAFVGKVRSDVITLESKVEKYLADILQKEAKTNVNDDFKNTLAKFKASINVYSTAISTTSTKVSFPEEVYKVLLAKHAVKYEPQIENIDGTLIKEMKAYIAYILGSDNETVTTADGESYKVDTTLNTAGLATVTYKGRLYTLNWRSNSAKESLYSLLGSLKTWGKNFESYFFDELKKDTLDVLLGKWVKALLSKNGYIAKEVYDSFENFLDAGGDATDIPSLANDNFSEWLSELTKKRFPNTNKEIAALQKKYKTLDDLAKDTALLKDYKAEPDSTADAIKNTVTGLTSYKNFLKAYNDLQTAIGQSTNNFDSIIPNYIGYEISNVVSSPFSEDNATITCADGNNHIEVSGSNVSVDTGRGNDTIQSGSYSESNSKVKINAGDGDDEIYNYSSNSTIDGGTGEDFIRSDSKGTNVSISGGDGSDTIDSHGNHNIIEGGAGNDSISSYGDDVTISGDDGADTIRSYGSDSSVFGGAGDDELLVMSSYVDGGTGADTISIQGSYVTAYGGGSFDYIFTKDVFNIASGASNVYINDFEFGDELNLPAGNYTARIEFGSTAIRDSSGKLIVWLKNFTDRLENFTYDENEKQTSDGDDSINNDVSNIKIDLGAGNDYIYNYRNNVTIDGDTGNDSIYNSYGDNVSISGGDGDDTVYNSGSNVSINGENGNDTVSNSYGDSVLIESGDGNDSIENKRNSEYVTLAGGAGNDTINNEYCKNVTTFGGDGEDFIRNTGSNVIINGDEGNDIITATGQVSYSNSGSGATKYYYYISKNIEIYGGNGNDSILASGVESALIDVGKGDDTILTTTYKSTVYRNVYYVPADYVTIKGGEGNDYIVSNGENNLFVYAQGDGNDTIYGLSETDTLQIENDANTIFTSIKSGKDIIINVSNEKILLKDAANIASANIVTVRPESKNIIGTESSETITNYANNSTITGGEGDDTITDTGSNVLFNYTPGDGNDLIYGFDSTDTFHITDMGFGLYMRSTIGNDVVVYIDDEAVTLIGANDKTINITGGIEYTVTTIPLVTMSVYNAQNDTMIYGTNNSDTIKNSGNVVIINANTGNDSVYNEGNLVTITGGKGNDYISLSNYAQDNLVEYRAGDGNDVIYGFNSTSTLSISGGEYTCSTVGNDVIIMVGDGSILLKDAKGKTLNIDGTEVVDEPGWKLSGKTATYGTTGNTLVTVSGVKSLDGLSLSGKVVTVSASALSTETVTISKGYTLALGNNVIQSTTTPAGWTLSGTTATYKNATTSAGYTLLDNQIIYTSASSGNTLVTVSGVKSLNGISLNNKVVTISNSALNKDTVTVSNGYTLALGNDVTKTSTANAGWNLSGSTATYKIASTSAGYKLEDNKISYVSASSGGILITVNGVKSLNGLSLNNKVVTVSNSALNQKTMTISNGYTLALGNDVPKATLNEIAWTLNRNTATLIQRQSIGYVCNGSSITYSSKATTATLATLTGVQSIDGLSVDGNVITLSEDALDSSTVKLTKGNYKLALDDSVIAKPITEPTWFISGTKATYKDGNSAYYSLASNGKSVNFVKAAADKKAKDLITLSGVNKNFSADNIELDEDNKVVTLYDHALNKKTVTIAGSENYSLALADNVTKATVSEPEWNLKKTTATLSQKQSIGYVCNGGSITYSSKSATVTLATLTGVQSVDGLSVDDNIITLSEDALGSSTVKLTKGNYKLELDDNVATEPTTEPTWFISGTKTTYKDGNSAYYSLASNGKSVNFVKAAADKKAKDLITLNGVNKNFSADDVEIDENNKVITLSASSLDKKNVTIGGTEDYSLALGDDVPEITLGKPKLEVKGSKATLTQSTSIGYVLTNDKTITYSKKVSATTLATVTGVKSKSGISFDESSITLANSALTNKVTVSGDVSFEFKANYKNASITGSKDDDVISVLGTGVSVTGGKGDDYLTSGGGNTFIYASGDGDDVIADFTSSDKLKITNGDFSVDTDGSDVIVSVTKGKVTGSITLSNAAGQSITIIDSKNKGHLFFTSASDFNYWFDEDSFDTKSDISTIANSSDTNCQVGALNNLSEMNHKLNSFDSFSDEEKYFVTYCDKK